MVVKKWKAMFGEFFYIFYCNTDHLPHTHTQKFFT